MSDLDKKYPLRLDTRIDFKNLIPHFYVSDNETSDFYIKFTNDNEPVSVENIVIAIVVVNPNNQINSSLLDVNIDKGLIYCNLPNELKNIVGVYKAKIMCISEEERLVSNTFEYRVDMDEFAILNELTQNSDEILLLTEMLSQLNMISIEEEKRVNSENTRVTNETERVAKEQERNNNENERQLNETERINNENERQLNETNRNLAENNRAEAELIRESQELERQNNEVDRIAYDEVLSSNEEERTTNESNRIANEESRANSENIRINNENNRERNEQIRQNNEEDRKFNFTMQSQSLTDLSMGVNAVKEDILRSESDRKSSEEERKSNELLRISNEDVRISNEETRVRYEESRVKAESTRATNEETRERNESVRRTNENTRVSNENKRINAESTRTSNENIRVNAENRRRNEHTDRMAEIDEALANLPDSLPVANQTTLGGIKVGAGLSITADGILSATGGGTADSMAWENVVGRPTKLSQFTNDSGFIASIPSEYITETELDAKGYLTEHQDLSGYAPLDSPNFTNSISMGRKEGTTVGKCSIALGGVANNEGTIEASGNYSIATGFYSVAKGAYSHAEGFQTKANKNSSHAEGVMTTTDSTGAHAEGGNTVARGYFSHSEGYETIASGEYQHVQGKYNIEDTENKYTHIVGNGASDTARSNAHTLDWDGNAWFAGKLSQDGTPTEDKDLTTKKYVDNAISNMSTSGGSGDGFNTISSNLILSLTASEIQNSIDSGTEITLSSLDGIFDENKRYIVEFLGERKLSSIYPTNNNEVIHWNISCNFGDSLVDLYYSTSDNVMKLGIVKKDTDTTITATDFKVYEETVVPFDAKYLPMNLTMQNSISMGRIGEIGNYSIALGFCTEASGYYSFSQGRKTTANGNYSHAEGYDTTASSNASHTEGIGTTASGNASHAEGYGTKASNYYSHSEGCGTTASGVISHAEGFGTKAIGDYSHVEGSYTTASSSNQHVQGKYNIEDTENKYAHIVGNGTDDKARSNAHTLDWNGNAWYKGKLSQEGSPTADNDLTTKKYVDNAISNMSTSGGSGEGFRTISSTPILTVDSTTIRNSWNSSRIYFAIVDLPLLSLSYDKRYVIDFLGKKQVCSLADGKNLACNFETVYVSIEKYQSSQTEYATAVLIQTPTDEEGYPADISNMDLTDLVLYEEEVTIIDSKYLDSDLKFINSIGLGRVGTAGSNSCAIGYVVEASGKYSHAEGAQNHSLGQCSHTEGVRNIASGNNSHAEGAYTKAKGYGSHAEGYTTTASGYGSHAEGYTTTASGYGSHAEGESTIASSKNQHVEGRYNIEDTENKYAHIVGNGIIPSQANNWTETRSNAHTLDWDGNAWYKGNVSIDGTPTNDNDLVTKKYVDDSIATVNADTIDNLHIWTGTQAQYDALDTKDANTIYLIKEG